ncbi:hypothetical protein [Terribacillus sp. 7520-G]|uniref:hypothetical protein n=1 Tax=Terribacillus sp. 7520-G TaxID=2025389 RepID=UPI000BA5239D|nr:hypothetical protein [Terribacillus sp. 7520-G]PAD39544.1 hypothetical protein CHH53_04855 [Terribacillus sp. 7520-G]
MQEIIAKIKRYLRDWHNKRIVLTLVVTGCTISLGGFSSPIWLTPLIEFINQSYQVNITVPDSKVDYVVMFSAIITGIILICLGINYVNVTK